MRSAVLMFALGMAMTVPSSPASADENWDLLKLSCAPEIRFFEASRINLLNPPHGSALLSRNGAPRRAGLSSLAKRRGIYDVPTLAAHPFDCHVTGKIREQNRRETWPGFQVRVRAVRAWWAARIEVNGKGVGTIGFSYKHARTGVRYISVEDDGVGIFVRVCTQGEDAACREGYLNKMIDPE